MPRRKKFTGMPPVEKVQELIRIHRDKEDSEKNILTPREESLLVQIFGLGASSFTRFPLFCNVKQFFSPAQYWYALGRTYPFSDGLYEYRDEVKDVFQNGPLDGRRYVMTHEERSVFESLPSEFTIFRAMTIKEAKSENYGISWTLSKEHAEFFRDEYSLNFDTAHLEKTLVELTVQKSSTLAYFDREDEIIYIHEGEQR